MIEFELLTVNEVADVAPNLTAVAPLKPVPVIVTLVPPAAGPEDGLTLVTEGMNLNVVEGLVALVPAGVVTVTFTEPDPGAVTAVI